jgi:hypothetical protein
VRKDPRDNYLLLDAKINNESVIFGSIYGPNDLDQDFFRALEDDILSLGPKPIIIGGDWNATYSCLRLDANPDIINMQALPNLAHSKLINSMSRRLNLTDPYRILYPYCNDYSYIPWSPLKLNRSRLDFFLISKNIALLVSDCDIKLALQSKLFDHKAIYLDFTDKKTVTSRPSISARILHDPDIEIVVKLSVYECYVQNLPPNDAEKQDLLMRIGRCHNLLRRAGPDPAGPDPAVPDYAHAELLDPAERETIFADLIREIYELDEKNIENKPVILQADVFMEMLINCIKNDVITYQAFVAKKHSENCKKLTGKITLLKQNLAENFEEISILELQLRDIEERKINLFLEKNINFGNLNGERMTPFFLKMIRGNTQTSSMKSICDYQGRAFDNQKDQNKFIKNHFANSYKKNPDKQVNLEGCIEDFLGAEILAHPVRQNLKLNEIEKQSLEGPITEEELDYALEGANLSSAPGLDGINTRFIKRFWVYFKKPLVRYAEKSFETRFLTQSFRSSVLN